MGYSSRALSLSRHHSSPAVGVALLLDIVQSEPPRRRVCLPVYLSYCGSITDEVIHLAAAVHFCGFRSVVGTMWAMGRSSRWARSFYESVFSKKWQVLKEALRDPREEVTHKGGMTLKRWVNFVHYGCIICNYHRFVIKFAFKLV